MKMTIMGLDPSLSHTGWCIAEVDTDTRTITKVIDAGTVVTEKSKQKSVRKSSDDLVRAKAAVKTIQSKIKEHGVRIAVSEVPSGAQSASASRAFGIVVGILASLPIPLIEVNPIEVKLASVGTKIADKEDIVRWAVTLTENHPIKWNTGRANDWEIMVNGKCVQKNEEHMADSIATVQAGITSNQFSQLVGMIESLLG